MTDLTPTRKGEMMNWLREINREHHKFTFIGPQATGPMFRVHRADCHDVPKDEEANGQAGFTHEAATVEDAVANCIVSLAPDEPDAYRTKDFEVLPCAHQVLTDPR